MNLMGGVGYVPSRKPSRGDKVYDHARYADGMQPNGTVIRVDYQEHEAVVKFYDNTTDVYSFEDLEDCWDASSFGGTYYVNGP